MPSNSAQYLATADWLVIAVYLVGIISLGIWFGRHQKNTKDFFLGSRNMPWWGVGFSIIATETSALTFIGVPAAAYGADALTFIQIIIGYVIARVILAVVMVPHYFKGEIYSAYQLFENAFGPGARRTASTCARGESRTLRRSAYKRARTNWPTPRCIARGSVDLQTATYWPNGPPNCRE